MGEVWAEMLQDSRSIRDLWSQYQDEESYRAKIDSAFAAMEQTSGSLFSILHDHDFSQLLREHGGTADNNTSVDEWIADFSSKLDSWTGAPHLPLEPNRQLFLLFLNDIRSYCVKGIERQIYRACLAQQLPSRGVALIYADNVSLCYLARFELETGYVSLSFVCAIKNPRSILSIDDIHTLRDIRHRSAAKAYFQSAHKVVIHCGILTHVDRRKHIGVFGPSIDTLVMSSLVGQYVRTKQIDSFLEIGSGSGMIFSHAVRFSTSMKSACAVDYEASAIQCTFENVSRCITDYVGAGLSKEVVLVQGAYNPHFLNQRYDLIVSNPPYMAEPPDHHSQNREYERATTGTKLVEQIIASLVTRLSDDGRCLMMLSSTTKLESIAQPSGIRMRKALPDARLTVAFDVESAIEDAGYLDWMISEELIWKAGAGFVHDLIPVWFERIA